MMIKTHVAISALFILLFLSHVTNKFLFVIAVLIATFLPDIDSGFSTIGRKAIFRPVQLFVRHRSLIHSFTFCLLVSIILAMFFPSIAFGFFLGYGLHLLADSFTQEGIQPFWPYNKKSSGFMKTGGRIESSIFLVFFILDLALIALSIQKFF